MQQSTRYCGALLWRHWRTVMPSLYHTWSATSSQCKSACRTWDSPQPYLCVPRRGWRSAPFVGHRPQWAGEYHVAVVQDVLGVLHVACINIKSSCLEVTGLWNDITAACVWYVSDRALTLASPEVRFHIDSETHDPIDVQSKELRYAAAVLYIFYRLAGRRGVVVWSMKLINAGPSLYLDGWPSLNG